MEVTIGKEYSLNKKEYNSTLREKLIYVSICGDLKQNSTYFAWCFYLKYCTWLEKGNGFMHQKVILIDHDMAGVGTVNLDNRSFFLNFEVMGFVANPNFVESVEKMLQDDLAASV
jgi:phosphatidylserine/phosphatidylglycerophosphate/cardiolipin synthase-like enzyme